MCVCLPFSKRRFLALQSYRKGVRSMQDFLLLVVEDRFLIENEK